MNDSTSCELQPENSSAMRKNEEIETCYDFQNMYSSLKHSSKIFSYKNSSFITFFLYLQFRIDTSHCNYQLQSNEIRSFPEFRFVEIKNIKKM